MNAKATMKALVIEQVDGPFVQREIPIPQVGPGQVLVKIAASGVNPLDTKIRAGKAEHARHPFPAVLGMDMAGTVVTVGPGVTQFQPGDEVFGMTGGVGGIQGSLAEYAVVDADLIALTMREAAALPLIFITAWEGLVDRARVHEGQKVLIHGGVGGVGHIAVQIAKAYGADVYATVSAKDSAEAASYGATPIDYRTQSVEDYVAAQTNGEGFDIVYDTVGGSTLDASFAAARRYYGHVLSCLGWGTHALAPLSFRGATYSGVFTLWPLQSGKDRAHHGEILKEAARLVDQGKLKVRLDNRSFTTLNIEEAHQAIVSGCTEGKIVIDVEDV
jgi:NADPH2:quinone reductase